MGETGRINDKYMGMRPSGYLTGEDQSFLGGLSSVGNEQIDSGVGQQQGMARTRLAQRRIGGAAAEGVLGDIGAGGSLARSRLASAIAGIGHGIYSANQQYAQGNVRQAWSNDIGAFKDRERQKAAQHAMWANIVSGLAGTAGSIWGGGAGAGGAGDMGSTMGSPDFQYPVGSQ